MKKIVRSIVFTVVLSLVIAFVITMYFYSKNEIGEFSIMHNKEIIYKLYNEGIVECEYYYDKLGIESPNEEDKNIVFNQGLKYVSFPDLMKLQLEGTSDITFDGNTFKVSCFYAPMIYLEIMVDKEHIDNISYYKYSEKMNYKNVISIMLFIFIILCIIIGSYIESTIAKTEETKERELEFDVEEKNKKAQKKKKKH